MDDVVAQPVADSAPLGTPSVPTDSAGALSTPDDSLAAHEAAHAPDRPEPVAADGARDEHGRFQKPRRRAASQQADADDVPTINVLTARLKAAEDIAGKDIVRQEGESERVFTLRRRAELAERHTKPAPVSAPEPPRQAPASISRQSAPLPQTFPSYEAFVQLAGNEAVDYDTYRDIREDWGYQVRRQRERAEEQAQTEQRDLQERASAHLQRVTVARTKYADWDTVVNAPDLPPLTFVLRDAILQSKQSDDVQYYLGTHRDVYAELIAESQDYSPSAVQAMRRYLDTLVAPRNASSPSPRAAAGSTGSALALAPPPAPRPPNPVRTGAVTSADDPPGDGDSLAAHERAFGKKRRA